MKDHAQFTEDLALYAMGALDDQSCPELQEHLGTCGECRRELEALRSDMAMLALSATGPQPPQRSRQRLMAAVAAGAASTTTTPTREEQSVQATPPPVRAWPRWLFWAPLAACLVLAVHTVILWHQHETLRSAYAELEKDHARAQEIIAMLKDPNAQHMTLVATRAQPPQPQVKTIYVRDKGHVLLVASNLAEPPANKTYELWLLPASGDPMPAGTFKTDWRGHGMMLHHMKSAGIVAKGFAVTIEPEPGSDTPTMPIVMEPGN
ncbi:MAG TPA: anti-sigma factor [Candidatus Angelobacter sp.]